MLFDLRKLAVLKMVTLALYEFQQKGKPVEFNEIIKTTCEYGQSINLTEEEVEKFIIPTNLENLHLLHYVEER